MSHFGLEDLENEVECNGEGRNETGRIPDPRVYGRVAIVTLDCVCGHTDVKPRVWPLCVWPLGR